MQIPVRLEALERDGKRGNERNEMDSVWKCMVYSVQENIYFSRGNPNCNCSALVICAWHGGQGCLAARRG